MHIRFKENKVIFESKTKYIDYISFEWKKPWWKVSYHIIPEKTGSSTNLLSLIFKDLSDLKQVTYIATLPDSALFDTSSVTIGRTATHSADPATGNDAIWFQERSKCVTLGGIVSGNDVIPWWAQFNVELIVFILQLRADNMNNKNTRSLNNAHSNGLRWVQFLDSIVCRASQELNIFTETFSKHTYLLIIHIYCDI